MEIYILISSVGWYKKGGVANAVSVKIVDHDNLSVSEVNAILTYILLDT